MKWVLLQTMCTFRQLKSILPARRRNILISITLSFAYPKEQEVFRNVSFEAHAGDVIGILGHNGAGKTTLLSILTGLLKQRNGEITFDGRKLTPRQRRALSYLVMQDTDYQLFASSVEEELSLGIREDCKEKVDAALEALELSEYREQHPAALSGEGNDMQAFRKKYHLSMAQIPFFKNPFHIEKELVAKILFLNLIIIHSIF